MSDLKDGQKDFLFKWVEDTIHCMAKKKKKTKVTLPILVPRHWSGFEKFECVGEEFDPRKHEALLSSPSPDHEPNTVITELRPGYMKNDEVVRPAQVQIAVALPDASKGDNEG